jgi:glycosyltransferase involved in cell wall biosynthesis
VHTFHYGRYDQARGRQFDLEGRFCRIASNLIAVSEAQRRAIIARYALDPLRIATIPNGVRFTAPTPAQVAQHRTELGLSASDTVVGCIAVLSEQKGVAYLLEAARNLAPRYPDLRFLIVGGGPLEAHLRQQASELGLGSRIVFAGWRTDAAQFLPLFDVWVMASLWEAMPMALMEAMAAGIPIVATDVGDNRSIVADGRCAVLIPPASAGAIESAVSSLLDEPEQARAMAGRAAARYRDAFTTAHMVAHYERLFEGR